MSNDRHRAEYTARINRVIDHVEQHRDGDLSVEALARVACFSPFHFHRIFRAFVGEPPARFVRRVRIEWAAARLVHDPDASVTGVALDAGFGSPEAFARAFRDVLGATPSEWREEGREAARKGRQLERKNRQVVRKRCQATPSVVVHPVPVTQGGIWGRTWRMEMNEHESVEVNVQELEPMEVAYVRHIGPYQGDGELFGRLFGKLFAWAGPRGLVRMPETKTLCVYHDDPNVTEEDHLRVSVCLTVPPETAAEGEVGRMSIPGGLYAIGRFELDVDGYAAAWNALYGGWLPQSGYQPDDRPCFEQMLQGPDEHPEGKHVVAIHIPVKPL